MKIQLSDHFSYRKLVRFTLPSIAMMIDGICFSIVVAEVMAVLISILFLILK